MAEIVNSDKCLPPGMKRHKCPRCKGAHQSYFNYPTICEGNNCFERGLDGVNKK